LKRALAIVGALILGILGLFMSLCGGGFTVMGLSEPGSAGLLVITIPSLLFGMALIWLCVRMLSRVPREPEPPAATDDPERPNRS
jgi:hypothetical protein